MTLERAQASLYFYKAEHLPPRPRERPDADTMRSRVSLGMFTERNVLLRLARINAIELSAPDGSGYIARDYMRSLWPFGVTAWIYSYALDKYGRWLADVWLADGRNLSDALVDIGYAEYRSYMT